MTTTPKPWAPTFNLDERESIPTQVVDIPPSPSEKHKALRAAPKEIAIAPSDLLSTNTLLMVIGGLFADPLLEKMGASDLYWIANAWGLIVLCFLVRRSGNRLLLLCSIQWAIAFGISSGASVLMDLIRN